jgi:hypothetical protein
MTVQEDAGEEIISRLVDRFKRKPQPLTLWRRGLTWHPRGFTQHIWAEAVPRSAGLDAWRVHVRTWCLKRVAGSPEQMHALAEQLLPLTLAALVRKPGSPSRLGLATAIYMSAERVEWTARVIAAAATRQVHDAARLATSAALLETGVTGDLISGQVDGRESADAAALPHDADTLSTLALEVVPFDEMAATLRAHNAMRAIATHSGVTASFVLSSDGERQEVLFIEARINSKPSAGRGLVLTISVPLAAPPHLLHALALNEAELQGDSPTDLVGGWRLHDGALVHETFVPHALCTRGMIQNLAEGAVRRAEWVRVAARAIVPADWPMDMRGRVLPFRRPF